MNIARKALFVRILENEKIITIPIDFLKFSGKFTVHSG